MSGKKSALIAATVLVSGLLQNLQAQTEKGTIAVGIQAAKGIWPTDRYTILSSTTTSSFRLTPSIGFFPKRNVLIGVGLPIESGTTRYLGRLGEFAQYTSSSVGLSLMARRYFSGGRLKPFIHLEGGYTWNRITSSQGFGLDLEGPTPATIRANAGVGVSYFLSNRLSLDATATLGVSDVQGAFRTGTLSPSNRFLLIGIGANWYIPSRTGR